MEDLSGDRWFYSVLTNWYYGDTLGRSMPAISKM
jgi:hypothetical protein